MIRLLSLFSGIGAYEKALENLGIEYELVGYCEIDKYASKAYSLIHNVPESKNFRDVSALAESDLTNFGMIDMIVGSAPCTDISIAGTQQGFFDDDGNPTRSGLIFDMLKIIDKIRPKYVVSENVKNMISPKYKATYSYIQNEFSRMGYELTDSVLNAKDYCVPQNRERVFMVAIRNDVENDFKMPEPKPLTKRLKDVLEDNVDQKYFISEKGLKYMDRQVRDGRTHWDFHFFDDSNDDLSRCLTANLYKGVPYNVLVDRRDNNGIIQLGNCKPTRTRANPNQGRVYSTSGIAPTLNCDGGGNRQPYIVVEKSQ